MEIFIIDPYINTDTYRNAMEYGKHVGNSDGTQGTTAKSIAAKDIVKKHCKALGVLNLLSYVDGIGTMECTIACNN